MTIYGDDDVADASASAGTNQAAAAPKDVWDMGSSLIDLDGMAAPAPAAPKAVSGGVRLCFQK